MRKGMIDLDATVRFELDTDFTIEMTGIYIPRLAGNETNPEEGSFFEARTMRVYNIVVIKALEYPLKSDIDLRQLSPILKEYLEDLAAIQYEQDRR